MVRGQWHTSGIALVVRNVLVVIKSWESCVVLVSAFDVWFNEFFFRIFNHFSLFYFVLFSFPIFHLSGLLYLLQYKTNTYTTRPLLTHDGHSPETKQWSHKRTLLLREWRVAGWWKCVVLLLSVVISLMKYQMSRIYIMYLKGVMAECFSCLNTCLLKDARVFFRCF